MNGHILVVGAGGGMGSCVTRKLVDRGYSVIATVSRDEKIPGLRAEIPRVAEVLPLDLSDARGVRDQLMQLSESLDRLDGVIVCAAATPVGPMELATLDAYRDTLEINCVSHLAIYQATIPSLRRSRGRLIYIGSISGRVAMPLQGVYSSSKFALEALCDAMRLETADQGVDVILVEPGATATSAMARSKADVDDAIGRLTLAQRDLYGAPYINMQRVIAAMVNSKDIAPPTSVADVIIEAFESRKPYPRYWTGADAQQLLLARNTKDDREMDAFILGILNSK
jgi:NAD(P)-dependent dehydrogenase (short-subunit alcohol dehydrogenase family)